MKILTIVGNRPQFIKLGVTARRLRELGDSAPFRNIVVNTGQHYDQMLSDVFFSELEIEAPDYDLAMGSGNIVDQIGRMLAPLREIVEEEKPDGILVYGDTNSTIAGAIVAGHLDVPLVHVEGGERLYRRSAMPEEVNRIVTDHLADLCLASSRKAVDYLTREGFGPDRVRFVGDPMYDIFKISGEMLTTRRAVQPSDFALSPGAFGLCTVHRAENTDDRTVCLGILEALDNAPLPILLPAHPRLLHRLEQWGWQPRSALRLVDPLGYFDFQSLLRQCAVAITDSGGVGREAFFAGKPTIVPLESSAWIEAVEAGLAVMTGQDPERLGAALHDLRGEADVTPLIEANFGKGDAGARIVDEVAASIELGGRSREGAWHPVARFGELPNARDASALSHAAFATLAARHREAGRDTGQIVLDITRSPSGAEDLAGLAAAAGASVTLLLDVDAAAYNPISAETLALLSRLAAAGHRIAAPTPAAAELLGLRLGVVVDVAENAEWIEDVAGNGDVLRLSDIDLAADARLVRIRPWAWHAVPVGPFESELRLQDDDLRSNWRQLRKDCGARTE